MENYVKFGKVLIWQMVILKILAGIKFGEFRQNSPNSPNLIPAKINPIKVQVFELVFG